METAADMTPAGARILMVDDDPGIRDVVSDFLGKHGFRVDTAGDAFHLEDGIAVAVATSTDPRVLDAADACPMGAITVIEVKEQAA